MIICIYGNLDIPIKIGTFQTQFVGIIRVRKLIFLNCVLAQTARAAKKC